MKSRIRVIFYGIFCVIAVSALTSCDFFVARWDALKTWSPWARSVTAGASDSLFSAVAADSSGNVYAAGYKRGNGAYSFGADTGAQSAYNGLNSVVVVKYIGR